MLQRMRDKIQGWVAGVIIAFIILALGFWGISYYFHQGSASGETAATFKGNEISQAEFDAAYNRFRMQSNNQMFNDPLTAKLLKQQLLQQLINQKLLAQAALADHLTVSQDQLNRVLLQIPAFQLNGQFSRTQFQGVVEQMLYTVPEFLATLTDSMLVNQQQSGTSATSFGLPSEVNNNAALLNQQRYFNYAIISKDRVMNQIKITPDAIQDYYQQHQNDFLIPEQVSLQYVTLSAQDIMQQLKPTSAQLMSFYQNNISEYTQPVRWHVAHILMSDQKQAETIYQQAKGGSNFTALVQKNSQDLLSAKQGGVLPWFSAGQLDPNFEAAVSKLKVGEISQPVATKYGFEIIKLLGVEPQKTIPYSQVSDKVRQAYLLQQAQKQFADQQDQLANLSFENPNSLENVAQALKLPLKTTENFTQQGGTTAVTRLPQVVTAAFSADVLAGSNSDVINIAPDQVAVIRVLKHQSAAVKPLAAVQNNIKQLLLDQGIQQQMQALGDKLTAAFKSGLSLDQIAKQFNLSWHYVMTQQNQPAKNVAPAILNEVFSLPRPATAATPSIGGVMLANNDYAFVALQKVNLGSGTKISANERKAVADRLASSMSQDESSEYINYLRDRADVKITA